MKGLFVKDMRLLSQRKRYFLLLLLVVGFMAAGMSGSGFVVGWSTLLMTFYALGTLSYDEYDNCMPFLMSMPVSRKDYALEKYLFTFAYGLAGWLFALVLEFVFMLVKHTPAAEMHYSVIVMVIFIPLLVVIVSVFLPIELKWGTEKGRTAIFIVYGVVFAGAFILSKLMPEGLNLDERLAHINPAMVAPIALLIAVVILVVSIMISIKIMNAKEF